ncbi:MAG: dihydroorotase family protein [Campylobacter sp.]|nr:dihydroorotase family protein [Campylobacter sp.]
MKFDLLLKDAYLVDNSQEFRADIGIKDGIIEKISPDIDPKTARETIYLKNKLTIPGIIDPHVHLSSWLGGGYGHKMLLLAGVTTTLDMAGPFDSVVKLFKKYDAGLNIASVEYVRPGHTVSSNNPSKDELEALCDKVLSAGSLGIKLLGGHYPLTPEATALAIEVAKSSGAYTAFHAGTTKNGSNLNGALEAIELANGNPLHLAHINAYCRGAIYEAEKEAKILLQKLSQNKNIKSESYLSKFNGTSGELVDGKVGSNVTRKCLADGGFSDDEKGVKEAILSGYVAVNAPKNKQNIMIFGEAALKHWQKMNTDVTLSFAVNPASVRAMIASKKDNGEFIVGSISTDGGGIVRNVIVPMGLNLVDFGFLSLKEFAQKTSLNPAKMLGLTNKGKLKEGFDADIAVINLNKRVPYLSVIGGKLAMYKGKACKLKGKIITTKKGKKAIEKQGINTLVVSDYLC